MEDIVDSVNPVTVFTLPDLLTKRCDFLFFVADGINSVGDYNSPPGGCRVCLCLSPLFFMFHDGITSKRFELSG